MTCEQCQESISAFLDNELDLEVSSRVQTHLALCGECAKLCEDFASILEFCSETPIEEDLPPNSKALWCRINNIIESEVRAEIVKEHKQQNETAEKKGWRLSVPQLVSAVLGIALVSSLLTIIGIKNYSAPDRTFSAASSAEMTIFDRVLGKIGLVETPQQMRERQIKDRLAAIEYWNKRVTERRAQWDSELRDVFDRNLREIDRAVFQYSKILEENPQDELSGEMLDSTLNEKMELLREFSEL